MKTPNLKNQKGMTLIEVMVSLLILSFMAIFTGDAIRNALSSKTRIQKNIDRQAAVRDALKVMERDINLAFQFRDPAVSLHNAAVSEREKRLQKQANDKKNKPKPPVDGSATAPPPEFLGEDSAVSGEKMEKRQIQVLTQFVGEKDKLSFSSMSNVRMRADDPTSSIAEIGYHLKNCRRRSSQARSTNCLWRRVSPVIGTDVTKDGAETVLLENVEKFEMRYLGPGREEEWVDSWITNERGDDTTRFKFPYAVEITVEVSDPGDNPNARSGGNKKTLRMIQVAALRNPGNIKQKAQDPNAPQEATGEEGQDVIPQGPDAPGDGVNQ